MLPRPLQPRIAQRADTSTLMNAGPLAVASMSPQTASLRVRQAAEPFRCATDRAAAAGDTAAAAGQSQHENPPQLLVSPGV